MFIFFGRTAALPYDDRVLFDTRSAFEGWLRLNHFLEDVVITAVEIDRSSSTALLRGTQQVRGGHSAGDVRIVRPVELRAYGAYDVTLRGEAIEGHWSEGITLRESVSGLSFAIDVPGMLSVTCDKIEITQSPDRAEIVEKRLDCARFAVTIHGYELPTPQEITDWCSSAGLDVVWRYYGGEAIDPRLVPPSDYAGWFVQLRERLGHSAYGVLFYVADRPEGFYLAIETREPELQPVSLAIAERLAAMNPSLIQSGNATLGATEWIEYMRHSC